MDFDKTSFSVDWYTPGDKYGLKRLSFPKSACISIDDLVPASPLSFCFNPVDTAGSRPRSYSFVDSPLDSARVWANDAPLSPLPDREHDNMYDLDPKECGEDVSDWQSLASPGLLSIANDCALCGVDLDVSCLLALDEHLLRSPVECFTEQCWADAVREEVTVPAVQKSVRTRARSFKCDYERALAPLPDKDYPGSFERTRPLAARIMLPLDRLPHYISTPSYHSSTTYQEKPAAYFHETDRGRSLALPVGGIPVPRHPRKREAPSTRSYDPRGPGNAQPSPTRPQSSKTNHTFRVISDAYSTFTRSRQKSRH